MQDYYLVKWKGYSAKENTWEPAKHLEMVQDMVDEFEESKAEKPKKASPKPAAKPAAKSKSPPKRPKTANTRFMTTKPKRGGASKREASEPAPSASKRAKGQKK